MNLEQLKNRLPDYAKDIRLNLTTVLTAEGSPDLSQKQILLISLGISYALKNALLINAFLKDANDILTEQDINAAKAAATVMAMNNIYYRFTHLISDKSFSTMPAKLRMNVIGNPGIEKTDFELICLAVSAINGCGMCLDAHTKELITAGVPKVSIQSVIRIASVLNGAATGLAIISNSTTIHELET